MRGACLFVLNGITMNDLRVIDKLYENVFGKKDENIFKNDTSGNIRSVPEFSEEYKCYSVIPKKFYTPEKWIRFTNLRCWTCSDYFSNAPAFVPKDQGVDVVDGKSQHYYEVEGNFCSWCCVARYIDENYSGNRKFDLDKFALFVKNQFTGNNDIKIIQSPPKTLMQEYCGQNGCTRIEYRRIINDLEK